MYNEIIKLVQYSETTDEYGDTIHEESERIVFAKVKSIGQSEFYQAQAIGMKPEIKFVIADYLDYKNEKRLKYGEAEGNEEEYTIIRTYRTGKELELVCKRGIDL